MATRTDYRTIVYTLLLRSSLYWLLLVNTVHQRTSSSEKQHYHVETLIKRTVQYRLHGIGKHER